MRHDAAYEGLRYPRALYEDDLGILFSSASLKEKQNQLYRLYSGRQAEKLWANL